MKLGCNYLLETKDLVMNKIIDIDYFKFPALGYQMGVMEDINSFEEFCNNLTNVKPILLHGLYPAPHDLASPTLKKDFNFELVNRLIEITHTPGISFHPCHLPVDRYEPRENLVTTIMNNIIFLKDHYSHLDFISVENLDSLRFGQLIDPAIFSDIINATDCHFLLDISHAYCSARARNESFKEYIRKLPLSKVYEIHINGWMINENGIMCHVKIQDECYDILKDLLNYCNPEIITIEYGRGNDKIGAGIPLTSNINMNDLVKEEIIEQISKIRDIIATRF